MKSREKGIISLIVMAGATVALILGSEPAYEVLSAISGPAALPEGLGAEGTSVEVAETYEGAAAGFGGEVRVSISVDAEGNMVSVAVKADHETPEIGQAAAEKLAAAILEKQSAEVDGVSGATMTSNAVKTAASEALGTDQTAADNGDSQADEEAQTEAAGENETEATGETGAEQAETAEETEKESAAVAAEYEGSADGFGGEIHASVAVDQDGKIVDVKIQAESETPEIGQAAAEELAAAILEAQSAEVDGVSGATMTSDGVKEAVAAALASGSGQTAGEEDASEAAADEDAANEETEAETANEETVNEETGAEQADGAIAGVYEGSADGFAGRIDVVVSVDQDGKIVDVKIQAESETPEIGQAAAEELAAAILEAQSAEVDGISGATMTSDGVKEAVTAALASEMMEP